MLGVKLPFFISDCEDAAYALSREFVKKGYNTDVRSNGGIYTAVIYRQRLIHNVIGNPAVLTATFFPLEDGAGIEVREGPIDANIESVIKEIACYALIVPGIVKRIEAAKMERAVMRKALIVAKSLRRDAADAEKAGRAAGAKPEKAAKAAKEEGKKK